MDGRPTGEDGDDAVAAWSRAHGTGVPRQRLAGGLVRGWLGLVHGAAAPLARTGVPPAVVTALGTAVSAAALAPAAAGGRWAVLAGVLVAAGALLDGLDGAVARLSGGESRWGAVLDAAADRVSDAAALAVLWLLGAPAALVLLAAGAGALHEYARARAQGEGLAGPGAVTVSERPTRVAVAAMFALGCGVQPAVAPWWAGVGAAVAAVLALAGLAQVLAAVRRALR